MSYGRLILILVLEVFLNIITGAPSSIFIKNIDLQ